MDYMNRFSELADFDYMLSFSERKHVNEILIGDKYYVFHEVTTGHYKDTGYKKLIHITYEPYITKHNGVVNNWDNEETPARFYINRKSAGNPEYADLPPLPKTCYCDKCKVEMIVHESANTVLNNGDIKGRKIWKDIINRGKYPWEFEARNELTRPKCILNNQPDKGAG